MNVLLIGATSSIAHATARLFASDGDSLFLVGRNADRLGAVAADLAARGARGTHTYLLDAADLDAHAAMFEAATRALGRIDVALIAHGVLPDQQQAQDSVPALVDAFQVNALSVMALMTRLGSVFEAQGGGCIAVISSVAGDRGRGSNYVYGAAKAAVSTFAGGLRNRLASAGVRVVTIKPGFVDTPMTAALPKNALFASPEAVGRAVYRATKRGPEVVYAPFFWRYVMAGVRAVPERLFKRLHL